MYIQVRLLKGFPEPLWYEVPPEWQQHVFIGAAVKVPFRTTKLPAMIENIVLQKPEVPFAIKKALELEAFPVDSNYQAFIHKLAGYYCVSPLHFIKRMRQFMVQKELKREQKEKTSNTKKIEKKIILTDEQQQVVDFLIPHIKHPQFVPTVLHGVTGSGKTEIYKACITTAIAEKKAVLLLLPEVSLAVQFTQLLKKQLPSEVPIFSFHSATSIKEKRILWQKLLAQEPMLIIGVHLPILLPIAHLGLILVDEEHETGYQEKKHPKINSKEAALLRAQRYQIPIVLGSATPSVQTLHQVKTKEWHFFQLKKRFAGAFPTIKTVLLNDKKQRRNFWITRDLEQALKDRLAKKEQSIIFLNRRGFSFFVQCKACSFIFNCSSCSVSLTLHQDNILRCHYCDVTIQLPQECITCKASASQFIKKGIGTQQLVSLLQNLLPTARIGRADLDSTINKKNWQKTMDDFSSGNLDILVGTQTITKGYHFPNVTLVGILWADLNLHFPLYNAAETTLQQIIQVAGRAGRERADSLVIVQTMMDHRIFDYIHEVNYLEFYNQELQARQAAQYPPCIRLAELELKFDDENIINNDARSLALLLSIQIKNKKFNITLLGPALPPVYKIKNYFLRKIYLKAENFSQLIDLIRIIDHKKFKSSIFFTPNPL
jgi:primosomal protein N' (replication factor Y)